MSEALVNSFTVYFPIILPLLYTHPGEGDGVGTCTAVRWSIYRSQCTCFLAALPLYPPQYNKPQRFLIPVSAVYLCPLWPGFLLEGLYPAEKFTEPLSHTRHCDKC